ncbi:MAG: NUDIX hydrolase [Anaerolineae bacterium]|nr:NUDIX hydrolase [Anaerolineae bacterium]
MKQWLSNSEKPNALATGWQVHRTTYLFTHPVFTVREDQLTWPGGFEHPYTYIEGKAAVLIVPVTSEGQLVLIRQFRYIVDSWVWEVPAGGTHDFDGDDLADLARRELYEEIGGEAETLEYIDYFFPASGLLNAAFHIYLATGVRLHENHLEPGEIIEVHPMPISRALEMAHSGEMRGAPSAFALLRCEPRLIQLAEASDAPETAAIQVAQAHYDAIAAGDRERWIATLNAQNRAMADRRGSSPDFWWSSGRRYAEEYGVTYHFHHTEPQDGSRIKLFFERRHPDGTRRGQPVPIHLEREGADWRVRIASY